MPPSARPLRHEDDGSSKGGMAVAGSAAALLMILCCALPALIAAGALAGIGAWLASPWAIAAAVLLLVVALVTAVRPRPRR